MRYREKFAHSSAPPHELHAKRDDHACSWSMQRNMTSHAHCPAVQEAQACSIPGLIAIVIAAGDRGRLVPRLAPALLVRRAAPQQRAAQRWKQRSPPSTLQPGLRAAAT